MRIHQFNVVQRFTQAIYLPEPINFSGVITQILTKTFNVGDEILGEPCEYTAIGPMEVCNLHLYNRLHGNYIGKIFALPSEYIQFQEERIPNGETERP